MKTKKQILKGLKIVSLGVGSLCLLVAFFLFFQGSFFNINQVVCLESERPCDTEVWLKINSFFLGKNLLFLSPTGAQEKIKKELTTIESVRLEKKWPGRLVVSLSKKNPLAVVEVKDGYLQVDHQGTILAILTQPTDLPLVVAPGLALTPNQEKIDAAPLLACLDGLYQLLFKNISVRRAEMTDNQTLVFDLRSGPQVFFSLDREMKEQVDSLHLILERAKIEGKEMKTIDLRFVKPVVVYL